jgi:hypothetical protein
VSEGFQVTETFTLFQIGLFCWIEETSVSLGRKASLLEAGVSCTLFPYMNCVSFWTLYCLHLRDFKLQNIHYVQNRPIMLNWTNTCISWKKIFCVRSSRVLHMFPYENWVIVWRNTSCLSGFSSYSNVHFDKTGLCSWIEETGVSLGRKPSMLEVGASYTFFHYVNWVSFWTVYCLHLRDFKLQKYSLCSK